MFADARRSARRTRLREPEQVSPGLELRELDSELEQALRSLGPLEWARP